FARRMREEFGLVVKDNLGNGDCFWLSLLDNPDVRAHVEPMLTEAGLEWNVEGLREMAWRAARADFQRQAFNDPNDPPRWVADQFGEQELYRHGRQLSYEEQVEMVLYVIRTPRQWRDRRTNAGDLFIWAAADAFNL